MATEVGHAFVSLVPSMRGFAGKAQAELSRAGLDRSLSNHLTRGAGPAGQRAGGLFAGAFNARARVGLSGRGNIFAGLLTSVRGAGPLLAAAGGAAVVFGLKTASSLEQAEVSFTTMLGSAKRAKAFLGDLVQFAKTTPFDLPGVKTAAQQLLAFGFNADEVIPTLTALGDAAAGLSLGTEGLGRLTTAIGQIQAKGRVQSDELLQLTEAGVPALKILAAQFGTTTAQMQAMVTKGLVPAKQAIPALLQGLENGTKTTAKFGGLMEKQSHTLGGVFSNLKDSVTQGLGQAFRPLARLLEDVIPGATGKTNKAFVVLRQGIKASIPYLRQFGEFFSGRIMPVLRIIGGMVLRLARGLLPAFRDAWHSVTDAFRGSQGGISTLGRTLQRIGSVVMPVVIKVFGFWIRNLGRGLAVVIHLAGAFGDVFRTVLPIVGQMVSGIVRGFKYVADVWFQVIGWVVNSAAKAFGWLPLGLGDKLKDAAAKFNAFREDADAALWAFADDAAHIGEVAGNNFAAGFFKPFNDMANGLKEDPFFGHPSKGFDFGSGSFNGKNSWDKAKTPTSAFDKLSLGSLATGKDLTKSLSDGMKAGTDKAAQTAQDIADKILAPLRALKDKARQLAQSITQAITGDTGFGALDARTDSLGASFGQSVGNIVKTFVDQQKAVVKFRRQLRELERRGLSEGAIQDIAAQGLASGGDIASTLMGATRHQLRRISRARTGTNQAARGIGLDVAQNRFGDQISRELRRTQRAIEKASQNTDLTDKTIQKLGREYRRARRADRVYLDTAQLDRLDGRKVQHQS